MMKTVKLNVGVGLELYSKGIRKLLWVGDSDIEEEETWDEIIQRNIEYFIVGGKLKECHREEIEAIRKGLKKALKKFDKLVDEYGYEK